MYVYFAYLSTNVSGLQRASVFVFFLFKTDSCSLSCRLSHTPHPHHFGHGVEVEMLEQLAPYVSKDHFTTLQLYMVAVTMHSPLSVCGMCCTLVPD